MSGEEKVLLDWLAIQDGLVGECYGTALDGLIARGLAAIEESTEPIMYRTVSITDAGRAALSEE